MKYQVTEKDNSLTLAETQIHRSILQNIALILATPKGSVPMYREFGIDTSFLDLPLPVARVRGIPEIREAVEQFEPRARVVAVTFLEQGAGEGKLMPKVEVEILE